MVTKTKRIKILIKTIFRSELDNKRYYEIPFAYEEYYNKR